MVTGNAKPVLVAITGGSGSGKSTLARMLAKRLGPEACLVVTEDAYYLPRTQQTPPTVGWSNEEVERVINFDDPASKDMDLMRAHLEALKRGEAVDQPEYQFETHERTPNKTVRLIPKGVVVVEGVHVLSDPKWAALFDLRIYVDTPVDLRFIRRLVRDVTERGREPDSVVAQYLRFVRASHARFTEPAKHVCDIVVADEGLLATGGAQASDEATDRLAAPVWDRLAQMGIRPAPR